MAMEWKWEYLDLACVPTGLLLLVLHHAQPLYRVWRFPSMTAIGVHHSQQRVWVMSVMKDPQQYGTIMVQTLRNTMMASALLATAALMICSLIAAMVGKNYSHPQEGMILGDKRALTSTIKLSSQLVCFLVALICNVQCVRYYCQLSFLLTIPEATAPVGHSHYVNQAFVRASLYWTIGLRAFYFSLPMFLWMFGPLPMITCSLIMVAILHFADGTCKILKTPLCQHSLA